MSTVVLSKTRPLKITCKPVCNRFCTASHSKHKVDHLAYDGKNGIGNPKEYLLCSMKSANKTLTTLQKLKSKLIGDIKAAMEQMKNHELHQKEADINKI